MKLPVAAAQVGWVTELSVGVAGVGGCAFTVTLADAADVHAPSVAVTL